MFLRFLNSLFAFLNLPFINAHPDSPCANCTVNRMNQTQTVSNYVTINTSPATPFEDAKLSAINTTAWESYNFEGVSANGSAGVSVTFYRNPALALLGQGVLWVEIDAVWANGTQWTTALWQRESLITSCDDATYGYWNNSHPTTKVSFSVPNSLKWAKLNIFGPGVTGDWEMTSIAPAVTADGMSQSDSNASVELAPLAYWNEAIPMATLHAHFHLSGTEFSLLGLGGHGRNWAPYNWNSLVEKWYRVRAVAGPYSMLFWTFKSAINKQTYTSAVLSQNGTKIFSTRNAVAAGDSDFATYVLSYGGKIHGTYPENSTGIVVDFVGGGKHWRFAVEHANVVYETLNGTTRFGKYSRFVNTVNGGELGEQLWEGVATSDQVIVADPIPL